MLRTPNQVSVSQKTSFPAKENQTSWPAFSGFSNPKPRSPIIITKTHDVLYIPPGEKHMMLNKTDTAFRYLEFFTNVAPDDFVEVK